MDVVRSYIENLVKGLAPLVVTNGSPILMVQAENEYGSYGDNRQYMGALRDIIKDASGLPLYTNDGSTKSMLEGGQIHGVLAETDSDPKTGFGARDEYVSDPASLGPQLDGEYYVTWLGQWASNKSYQRKFKVSNLTYEYFFREESRTKLAWPNNEGLRWISPREHAAKQVGN